MKDIFEEIDGAATVVPGPQPGGGTGQPLSALGHNSFARVFVCLRDRGRHVVTDSANNKKFVRLEDLLFRRAERKD